MLGVWSFFHKKHLPTILSFFLSFFLSLLLRRRKVDFKSERENDDDSFLSKQLDAMNSVTSKELPQVNKS